MIKQSTLDKLHDMRLATMANAFCDQCQDTAFTHLSFEDRFSLLVDREWDKRRSNKLTRLIREAGFRYPNACMENIDYRVDRKLDQSQLLELSTGGYITGNHHIILKGASGSGKTYLACALGIAACRAFKKVRYIRLPDLFDELAIARGEGIYAKVMSSYQKSDLLILDEFLLKPLDSEHADELLEIIEKRSVRGSVVFCTQFDPCGWYERIGTEQDSTISEAIIDRILPNSHEIFINGEVSMRKIHGLKKDSSKGGFSYE